MRIKSSHYWMMMTLMGVFAYSLFPVGSKAVTPSRVEFDQSQAWVVANFPSAVPAAKLPPFSFVYGSKSSSELLKGWKQRIEAVAPRPAEKKHVYSYADPATGLELDCEITQYTDFPAVEWVLYFKNLGREATPILEQVRALDTTFRSAASRFVLHWARGSSAEPTDFAPRDQELGPGGQVSLSPVGGRSSNTTALPFFNLEASQVKGGERRLGADNLSSGGVMIGLGWSGQWSASFVDEADGVHIQAGMELTHLRLEPGERIRTPRMLLLFWKGADRLRAQNLLRRFILAHHSPRPGGHLAQLPVAACSWFAFDSGNKVTEENQIEFASTYKKMMPIDTFWVDAGWFEGGWPDGVGNWFVKKDAFPHGLGPLGDAVHRLDMRFIVWFEPERVHQGTWLDTDHPEWVLGDGKESKEKLLDLGNDDARHWLTEHISQTIKEAGIDIYRNDFNMDPLACWRTKDGPDRQGITEIRYVEGLYEFWDELLRRYPGLMIDNCASGGRRIDLETISRSVALWRSDYVPGPKGAEGMQALGGGLALWVPLSATGALEPVDVYGTRSAMAGGLAALWDVRRSDFNARLAKRLVNEEARIRKYYEGDFYPLTAISVSDDVWVAYQYDRPDLGEGMVMAFRRAKAAAKAWTVKVRGLQADRRYELEDLDNNRKQVITGKELAAGLRLDIPAAPGSALLIYRSKK